MNFLLDINANRPMREPTLPETTRRADFDHSRDEFSQTMDAARPKESRIDRSNGGEASRRDHNQVRQRETRSDADKVNGDTQSNGSRPASERATTEGTPQDRAAVGAKEVGGQAEGLGRVIIPHRDNDAAVHIGLKGRILTDRVAELDPKGVHFFDRPDAELLVGDFSKVEFAAALEKMSDHVREAVTTKFGQLDAMVKSAAPTLPRFSETSLKVKTTEHPALSSLKSEAKSINIDFLGAKSTLTTQALTERSPELKDMLSNFDLKDMARTLLHGRESTDVRTNFSHSIATKPTIASASALSGISSTMSAAGLAVGDAMALGGFEFSADGTLRQVVTMGTTMQAATQVAMNTAATPAAVQTAMQLAAAVRADRRSDNIEVRLDPPELGRVRIDFHMETADAIKGVLSAERAETLDHLRRNISALMDELKSAGFETVDLEFSNQQNFSEEFGFSEEGLSPDENGAPMIANENIVYLSMRENVQVDLLV